MDPGTRSRHGHSLEGQLLLVAGSETAAPGPGTEAGSPTAENIAARAGVDPPEPARAPSQRQSARDQLRSASQSGNYQPFGGSGDLYPRGTAVGRTCH